jgi:L-threonylcarbamoyladenylate synthase
MTKILQEALIILRKPGIILTPTETIVGISCSALSETQISRIYQIKKRPSSKSFIVLVDSMHMIEKFVSKINALQKKYLNSERPTTVIFNNSKGLPPALLAPDGTLAFRITKHPELKKLINQLGVPIVSTSANLNGESSALTLKEVDPLILDQVDYSLNLQPNPTINSSPSRIVKIIDEEVEIIRE